jgi:hypothetical protein
VSLPDDLDLYAAWVRGVMMHVVWEKGRSNQ